MTNVVPFPPREPEPSAVRLLRADPHAWGEGKVHRLKEGVGEQRTLCGQTPARCPGALYRGLPDEVTCIRCLNSQETYEARLGLKRAALRAYHQTPRWKAMKHALSVRAGGLCEVCRLEPARRVQRLAWPDAWPGSVSWIQAERMSDLQLVCAACGDRQSQTG